MNVLFVRHALSIANERRLVTGGVNDSLSEEGIRQALDLRAWMQFFDFKIEKFITSHWARARQTAFLLWPNVDWVTEERVGETNAGSVSASKLEDFLLSHPNFYNNPENNYPNGESHLDLKKRVIEWLHENLNSGHKNILVVTHAGPICCVLHEILSIPMVYFPISLPNNASLTIIKIKANGGQIDGRICLFSKISLRREAQKILSIIKND